MVNSHDRAKALLSVAAVAALLLLSACATGTRRQSSLADVLEAKRGTGTQMEMLKLLGTPARTLRVGTDEVWVYLIPERNALAETGYVLSAFGAGAQGQPIGPPPPAHYKQLLLQFDGTAGVLKDWSALE